MLGGLLVVVLAGTVLWLRGGRFASTDDSYVRAAKLMVSTDVSGLVSSVDVREGQIVKAGDELFRIDPLQYQIALDNANAVLAQTILGLEAMKQDYKRMLSDVAAQEAKVQLDEATYNRYEPLANQNYLSKANFDQARFALKADKNQLQSLKHQAQVQLARLSGNSDIPVTQLPQYFQAKAQADETQRQLD
jgi:membrane fusion protein, multidrug efflux system